VALGLRHPWLRTFLEGLPSPALSDSRWFAL